MFVGAIVCMLSIMGWVVASVCGEIPFPISYCLFQPDFTKEAGIMAAGQKFRHFLIFTSGRMFSIHT